MARRWGVATPGERLECDPRPHRGAGPHRATPRQVGVQRVGLLRGPGRAATGQRTGGRVADPAALTRTVGGFGERGRGTGNRPFFSGLQKCCQYRSVGRGWGCSRSRCLARGVVERLPLTRTSSERVRAKGTSTSILEPRSALHGLPSARPGCGSPRALVRALRLLGWGGTRCVWLQAAPGGVAPGAAGCMPDKR